MRLYLVPSRSLPSVRHIAAALAPGVHKVNERNRSVAIVAGLLFVVYTLGWFVNWLARHHHNRQVAVGIAEIVLIGLIVAIAMFRWSTRSPMVELMPRLVVAVLIGCAASALISPFAGGSYPFKAGAGDFFLKIWIFLGASLVGMALGYVAAVAVGRDYRTGVLTRMERKSAARAAAVESRGSRSNGTSKPKQPGGSKQKQGGRSKSGSRR